MDDGQLAVVVILAVVGGAALPVLIELWVTARTTRKVLTRLAAEWEARAQPIDQLLTTGNDIAGRVRVASVIGAAVAPAVASLMQGFARSRNHSLDLTRRKPMAGNEDNGTVVRRSGFGGGRILLAMLGGAAAGAIAGLLLAPGRGAETREKIRGLAGRAKDTVGSLPKVVHEAGAAAKRAFANGPHPH